MSRCRRVFVFYAEHTLSGTTFIGALSKQGNAREEEDDSTRTKKASFVYLSWLNAHS